MLEYLALVVSMTLFAALAMLLAVRSDQQRLARLMARRREHIEHEAKLIQQRRKEMKTDNGTKQDSACGNSACGNSACVKATCATITREDLRRAPTDELLARGCELQQRAAEIRAALYLLGEEMGTRFPCMRTREALQGTDRWAERVVCTEWHVAPGRLHELRAILGSAYAGMIDEDYPMTPTRRLIALCMDARSDVGRLVLNDGLLQAETNVRYVYHLSSGADRREEPARPMVDARIIALARSNGHAG